VRYTVRGQSEKSVFQTVAFFMMGEEPVFLKPEPGYGIVSVSSPGPASQDPAGCHQQTGNWSV